MVPSISPQMYIYLSPQAPIALEPNFPLQRNRKSKPSTKMKISTLNIGIGTKTISYENIMAHNSIFFKQIMI